MIRFFTSPQNVSSAAIELCAEDAEHIRVLRLRPDEKFIVCDGGGTDYVCRLGSGFGAGCMMAEIVSQYQSVGEPSVVCKVFIAFSKGDRLDYAVQKAVELGAYEIVLFESARCVAVPNDIPKKIKRLQRIAIEAAKQSNRGIIPEVSFGGKLSDIVSKAADNSALAMFFYEGEELLHIREILKQAFPSSVSQQEFNSKAISIITGPEGGFEPNEVTLAQLAGISIVSLGKRILRSETAPIACLTAIMYHTGNL